MMLTKKQAAERLGVSLRTVEGLIARGALPAYYVTTRTVRIRESELEAFVNARRAVPQKTKKAEQPPRPCRYVPGMKVV